MDLNNLMAEMAKMQDQMKELSEKQAADAAEADKAAMRAALIKNVTIDDLNKLTERYTAAEEAIQDIGDAINALKQMLIESAEKVNNLGK